MEEGSLFQKKYRIGKKLGEGGMGVVYAAVQVPSGLPVAIKFVFARELSARNLRGERLLREAKVLAKLSHGNLVRLYDFDKTADGDYFIVMELVEGDTLHKLIGRARKQNKIGDPRHTRQMLHIMAQVAEGLAAAHKAGIVHRDLKPENVIVSEGGVVRVVDFGVAKNPSGGAPAPAVAETNPANVVGTPRYMAPEQVRGRDVDARTDIYAMGVSLYEALTGHPPYEPEGDEPSVTEIMGRHCFAEPTPLTEYVSNCSERISKLVVRCLAKEPSDRYQSARELAWDIRTVLAEELEEEEANARRAKLKAVVAAVDARETEPMSPQWTPGAVLPFVGAAPANVVVDGPRTAADPGTPAAVMRGVGFTTKMARPGAAAIEAAKHEAAATGRGVGFTTKLPRPSANEVAAASAHADLSTQAPHNPQTTHGASDPSWPSAATGVSFDRSSGAPPMREEQLATGEATRARRPRIPPLFIAPVVGTVVAVMALVAVMEIRSSPRRSATKGGDANPEAPPSSASPPSPPPSASIARVEVSVRAPAEAVTSLPASEAPPAEVTRAPGAPSTSTGGTTAPPHERPRDRSRGPMVPPSRKPISQPSVPPASTTEGPRSHNPNRLFGAEP